MSAVPAYSHYPERAAERDSRERISVLPGRGVRTQPSSLSPSVVLAAKAVAVVLVVLSIVAFARIGLVSAAFSASAQSAQLSAQISEARATGSSLEVSQSTLSNPTKLKQQAADLDMAAPASVGVIELEEDVVTADDDGALSLSGSVAAASGAGA